MEFNLRTMTGLDAAGYRRADPQSAYSLCHDLPQRYRHSCAAEAVQLWILDTPHFDKAAFASFGQLCRGFDTRELVEYCYSGIGNHLPITDRPADDIIAFCSAATAGDSIGALICRGTAAAISRLAVKESPIQICSGLMGDAQAYCTAYATGTADLEHMLPMPEL